MGSKIMASVLASVILIGESPRQECSLVRGLSQWTV